MRVVARKWTKEEEQYLAEKFGSVSISCLVKKLNRTESSILNKRQRMKLGAFLENGDYITLRQLLEVLGIEGGYTYKTISWIENRGFPIIYKKVNKNKFRVVNIDEFWKWAEENQQFLDFSNFEKHALGAEPAWVQKKREYDIQFKNTIKLTPWTQREDEYLKFLLNQYKYTVKEISQRMNRSEGAIQKRIEFLGIMQRPVKADTHTFWTDEEYEVLKEMILQGANYENIAMKLDRRGSKAIRGLVYRLYGTESLDKVRAKMKEEGKMRRPKLIRRNK